MKTKELKILALKAKSIELRCEETAKKIRIRAQQLKANGANEVEIVMHISSLIFYLYCKCEQLRDLVEALKSLERETETNKKVKTFVAFLLNEAENSMLNVFKEFEKEEEGV